tara:strand:- start:431 stop:739 length:309 start_codon:yes stop_codon:yes gene_type:complete
MDVRLENRCPTLGAATIEAVKIMMTNNASTNVTPARRRASGFVAELRRHGASGLISRTHENKNVGDVDWQTNPAGTYEEPFLTKWIGTVRRRMSASRPVENR